MARGPPQQICGSGNELDAQIECAAFRPMCLFRLRSCPWAVALLMPAFSVVAQNAGLIALERSASYHQLANGELQPLWEPFTLRAYLQLTEGPGESFVNEVTLQAPVGQPLPLPFSQANFGFSLTVPFDAASALEGAFGAGSYRFNLSGSISGNATYALNVPDTSLQARPLIANFAATQNIDPANRFVLRWTPQVSAPGFARLRIWDGSILEEIYDSGNIPGDETEVEIPSGLLKGGPNSSYVAQLSLRRVDFLKVDTAPSLVAYSTTTTSFELRTGTGTVDPPPSRFRAVALNGPGDVVFTVECTPGVPLNLQKSPALGAGWETVQTITPDASPATLTLPAATLGDAAFFQAVQ